MTRLTTYEATCGQCGRNVRSSHPLQMSLATGAAGVHLGPRALAVAADLNKAKELSMRKTCAVLRDCLPCSLVLAGLSQALDRLALKVNPQYDAMATELRQAPVLHSDETGWWVAGSGWWLWVFTIQLLTFYVVAQSRERQLLSDILGKDFGGVLVSDCLAIYDDATALQHKCISCCRILEPHGVISAADGYQFAIRLSKAFLLNKRRISIYGFCPFQRRHDEKKLLL